MSSFIGQLRISLGLDSAAFETGAKRAAAEVNTLGDKAERAGFKVGSMGKALIAGASAFAATAIVGQLKEAVTAGLEYAASLGETAQQLGVTTKTLQEYRYAADQVGISQEDMDTGLAKLTRTIGLAVEGGKKQTAAFEKLGISVRDANGNVKDAGDLIPQLAEALQKVGSPAERAAILVELFGKSGMKMGSLLADGAQGVNQYRESAQKLGIVISDDLINKADAASDKMSSLNKIITAKIAIAVAENADAILKLADAVGVLIDKASQAIGWLSKFTTEIAKADLGTTPFIKKLEDSGVLAKGAAKKYGAVYGLDENGNPLKAPAPTSGSGGALLRLPGKSGTFTPGKGPLANFAGGGALLGSNIANIASQAPGLRTPMFEGLLYQTEEIQNSLSKVNKAANDTADETETATVRVAKSFADMAQETISSLQNMASSIKSGDFLSILGSAISLFTQLASTGLFGKTLAGRVNAIPAHANGTSFHAGGLALVGERGPEIVDLPRGTRVYPNGTGPRGGGGGSQVQVIPSPYFDVVVDRRVFRAAPAIASAGGEVGYNKVQRAGSRRLG